MYRPSKIAQREADGMRCVIMMADQQRSDSANADCGDAALADDASIADDIGEQTDERALMKSKVLMAT